jgi:hypothetical protein
MEFVCLFDVIELYTKSLLEGISFKVVLIVLEVKRTDFLCP